MSAAVGFGWRLLGAVATLLGVSAVVFLAPRVAAGLDVSVVTQYARWLGDLAGGDLGASAHLRRPVAVLLAAALPATLELVALALIVAGVLGMAGGMVMFALRSETLAAVAGTTTSLLASVPELVWALALALVFAVGLEAMPIAGRIGAAHDLAGGSGLLLLDSLVAGDLAAFGSVARHLLLPVAALGIAFALPVMRGLGAVLAEIYREGYIHQARLRGLGAGRILAGHALRNATPPMLALVGARAGALLGGALVVEAVFAYPGLGSLLLGGLRNADLPVVQAVVVAYCAIVLAASVLTAALARLVDPRWGRGG